MKSIVLDGFAVNPGDLNWDFLLKFGEFTVYDKTPDEMAAEVIGDCDVVFTNRVKITSAVLDACPNIRYISALGTGYDMIDVPACRARGIEVCNVPGYSTMSVAQTAFSLLLAHAFDLNGYSGLVKDGLWTGMPGVMYQNITFRELSGKTAGIYGCGAIGTAFAKMCRAFGMKVLATRRSKTEGEEDGITYVTPDRLLRESDFLSLHCPLTDETRGMVDRGFIAKMKDGAVLINTSRGAVLNETDVAEALNSGKLGGAGLDVLSAEPARPDNPLLKSKNTIITPHCAWTSREARLRLLDILDANLTSFAETGKGINRVGV
ncbi:MAG: D-2-hydroxyacid dehydrogenase [Ruminococcaceae bacterium]|nr:D-2-hydroxyacid dehydrogenase [Oscillospiraceae bacterium]